MYMYIIILPPSPLMCVCVQIQWNQPALALHNFIRGSDKLPGAWSKIDGKVCTCVSMTVCSSSSHGFQSRLVHTIRCKVDASLFLRTYNAGSAPPQQMNH